MRYFAATCGFCGRLNKVQAESPEEARLILASTYVCLAKVHPSKPSVLANSSDFKEITKFEYLHGGS